MRNFPYPFQPMRILIRFTLVTLAIFACNVALAGDSHWPKTIETDQGRVLIYQPQFQTLQDDILQAKAALSLKRREKLESLFGAVWLRIRVETDSETRTVRVIDGNVTHVRFPAQDLKIGQELTRNLEEEIPRWNLSFPLDDLNRRLQLAAKEHESAESLNVLPPKILFVPYPATLVTLNGEPEWRPIENSKILRAVNTPFVIVFDPQTKTYYLDGGNSWFISRAVKGPWNISPRVPAEVTALVPRESPRTASNSRSLSESPISRIIVATEPTELLVTDGEPRYKLIDGNDLLYMSNTESDVLLDIESQRHFVLLSGRWYSSWSLEGPWTYEPADRLPKSFARIPPGSPKEHLLTHVAGTEQAAEAVLDAQVPRIAEVKRDEAGLQVDYDGEPRFERIEGTDMEYAVNTDVSVINVEDRYYAVHEGIWYKADDPQGPWGISDSVPEEIKTLPPDSPVYHVKYVTIYHSTPEVVYVGYTPGYLGSYVFRGTVVYGTGYHYRPWYGHYYYAWPYTWGFHVRYTPWYGWSFSTRFGFGYWWWGHPHHRHIHYRHKIHHHGHGHKHYTRWWGGHGGWWGPGGYRTHGHLRDARDGLIKTRDSNLTTRLQRKFPRHKSREFRSHGPGKNFFTDRFNVHDRIEPPANRRLGHDKGKRDGVRNRRKNFFTDRFNVNDSIRPGAGREFPRHSRKGVFDRDKGKTLRGSGFDRRSHPSSDSFKKPGRNRWQRRGFAKENFQSGRRGNRSHFIPGSDRQRGHPGLGASEFRGRSNRAARLTAPSGKSTAEFRSPSRSLGKQSSRGGGVFKNPGGFSPGSSSFGGRSGFSAPRSAGPKFSGKSFSGKRDFRSGSSFRGGIRGGRGFKGLGRSIGKGRGRGFRR